MSAHEIEGEGWESINADLRKRLTSQAIQIDKLRKALGAATRLTQGESTSCGNADHPHGPWHMATPIATSWAGRRRQRKNGKAHGCICEPHEWRLHGGYFWYRCGDCGEVS